jgi:hypothetical protein
MGWVWILAVAIAPMKVISLVMENVRVRIA